MEPQRALYEPKMMSGSDKINKYEGIQGSISGPS